MDCLVERWGISTQNDPENLFFKFPCGLISGTGEPQPRPSPVWMCFCWHPVVAFETEDTFSEVTGPAPWSTRAFRGQEEY